MKEQTIYICEICGSENDIKEDALKCENRHVKPVEITDLTYRGRSEVPSYIKVKMSDGRVVKYYKCQ